MSEQYDHALAAALIIMDELEARPAMPKHVLLSVLVYTILHALEMVGREPSTPFMN